jgi:hypothetical protein
MVTGGQDLGNERWKAEQEMIDRAAQQERMAEEAERRHAEDAAERGEAPAPAKKPWWKFWA